MSILTGFGDIGTFNPLRLARRDFINEDFPTLLAPTNATYTK